MSLRKFHLVFVSASLLLCALVLAWAVSSGAPVMAGGAGLLGVSLLLYAGAYFRRVLGADQGDVDV